MKRLTKIFTIIIAVCAIATASSAQDKLVNISLGGGLHPLNYKTEVGTVSKGGGVLFGCNYMPFFTKNFGLGIGFDMNYNTASAQINETFESEIDNEEVGSSYTLRTIFKDWKEKESMLILNIPLGIYGRAKLSTTTNFIYGVGVKVGMPVISRYKMKEGSIETRAYFGDDLEAELKEIPHHGLFIDEEKREGDIETNKICTSIFAELMFTFTINNSNLFHMGLYFSDGVGDLAAHHESMEGNNYHGIINSDLVDKCVPLCIGAKIGFSILPSSGGSRGASNKW